MVSPPVFAYTLGMPNFNEVTRRAARIAADASDRAMQRLKHGKSVDEDDITGPLVGILEHALHERQIDGITFEATIVRSGPYSAAEEKYTGADLLLHVSLNTPTDTFSKGVLVQSKKPNAEGKLSAKEHGRLQDQCKKMLSITPSSFVFSYSKKHMRVGAPSRLVGHETHYLMKACTWTPYRFFLEFFRSPIGDSRIDNPLVRDLPVPYKLFISARGEFEPFK